MPPARNPRRQTADTKAASLQVRTADQAARVAKDDRAEDKGDAVTVALEGQEFTLAQDVGIMPLMEWAAASDVDVASASGLRAVYYVLQDVVDADEWAEFRRYAREKKISAEKLLDFANSALEALAGRPTEGSSGSSDGS
jgi:hypothetical protein